MLVVPPDKPVTMPDDEPAFATEVLLLVHIPPGTPSLNVVVLPWQTAGAPVMGIIGLTVRLMLTTHPDSVV